MLILALHRFYKDELPESNWVPMYGLSLTIFIASVGLMPVPFIITIDVLPPKVITLSCHYQFLLLIITLKKKNRFAIQQ